MMKQHVSSSVITQSFATSHKMSHLPVIITWTMHLIRKLTFHIYLKYSVVIIETPTQGRFN